MRRVFFLVALCSTSACMQSAGLGGDQCAARPVDSSRELLVVDDSVLSPSGVAPTTLPWSPAHLMTLPGEDAYSSAWVGRGLEHWRDASQDAGQAEVAAVLDSRVLCPWLRSEPKNGCDDSCVTCQARSYSLALAPFRTIAVANRLDLGLLPDARTEAGEGRVVLGFVPAEAETAPPVQLTLIFEFALDGEVGGWAKRWHALGDRGSDFSALANVVDGFVSLRRLRDGAPALSQVRANLIVDGQVSELRELGLGVDGELAPRALRNTPRLDLDGSPELVTLVQQQASRIQQGTQLVPKALLALSAEGGAHDWSLPGVDAETRREFDRGTCAGCHANAGLDGFHVSPLGAGSARVSRFLSDPAAEDDELRRRARGLDTALCEP